MIALREFLLARITEEEQRAQVPPCVYDEGYGDSQHPDRRRVAAQCAALRRIVVDVHHNRGDVYTMDGECAGCGTGGGYGVDGDDCETLRLLALPYTDHKDYDQGWAL